MIQASTVRRLTREQRGDELSKRAFDNVIGTPRNLLGSKPSVEEQTVHGEKWTWTPGCKGCMWSLRGYHHTKACDARKRAFLVAKARAEELRVAEAATWRGPSSAMPSSSTPSGPRNEGCNLNLPSSTLQMLSRRSTRRCRTVMPQGGCGFQPDPGNLEKGGAQKAACCGKTFATALDGHRHRVGAA